MTENLEEYPDRIAELYKGKTIFITGGTGFMGKVLIEKLLRSCSDLKKIYIMVRSKKGKHPKDRIREIFSGPLFDMVKEQKGANIIEKVEGIVGDVMLPNLGLNQEDREMLANDVDFIFHCAATIRFDEPLKNAVLLNARGTKFMLDLAKECKHLQCFAHVSTAYCHLSERILYEKPYPPPADPHNVIKTVEWLSDDVIDAITPKILGDIPNTYAFTKALGEALVVEQMDTLPVIILRPSVVIPIWKEPIPGWTDNINGPTGLLIGAGKGVLRTMYCKQDSYADYLPVDIAVNATIICVYYYCMHNKQKRIYNLTSSAEYKITMEEIINIGRKVINERIPLNGVAWYPGGSMKRHRIVHLIAFFFFHIIPAVLVDALLLALGYKPVSYGYSYHVPKYHSEPAKNMLRIYYRTPLLGLSFFGRKLNQTCCVLRLRGALILTDDRPATTVMLNNDTVKDNEHNLANKSGRNPTLVPSVVFLARLPNLTLILCRVQKRIWKGFGVFEYYANNQWDFDNEESRNARELLNPREKETYKCDGDGVDYFEYFTTCVHAARLYILKETDDTLPSARRHMLVMWVVDKVCKVLFSALILYYIYKKLLNPMLASL